MRRKCFSLSLAVFCLPFVLPAMLAGDLLAREKKDASKNRYEHAVRQLDRAIEQDPQDATLYLRRGQAYVDWSAAQDLQLLAKADADFARAIDLDPKLVLAYADRAQVYNRKGQYDKAIETSNQALGMDQTLPQAYGRRSAANRSLKKLNEARKDAEEMIRLAPKLGSSYNTRANVSDAEKKYKEAIADWEKMLEVEPKFDLGVNNYAWFLLTCPEAEFRDGKRALELAKRACELTGNQNGQDLDTLAMAYAATGQFKEAQQALLQALEFPKAYPQEQLESMRARLELYKQGKAR